MSDFFSLTDQVAVVTGGTSGIGLKTAERLLAAGAKVVISGRKDGTEIADKIGATFVQCDVSNPESVENMMKTTVDTYGKIDILVNNAGATWGAPIEAFPEAGWDKVMDINVKGPFFLTQALLPLLEAAATADDPARIINVGSIDGINVNRLPTYSYAPSKAAIHHLTRMLAAHLADRHITANAIAPGPFPSKMMAATLEEYGEQIRKGVPLGRIGEADDMAGAAIFLASKAANYVTGVVLPVDGGITGCAGTL